MVIEVKAADVDVIITIVYVCMLAFIYFMPLCTKCTRHYW